jgi:hypothetical protein
MDGGIFAYTGVSKRAGASVLKVEAVAFATL